MSKADLDANLALAMQEPFNVWPVNARNVPNSPGRRESV